MAHPGGSDGHVGGPLRRDGAVAVGLGHRGWVGTLLRDSAEYVLVLAADGQIVFSSPSTRTELAAADNFTDLVSDPGPDEVLIILAGVTSEAIPGGPHEMLLRGADAGQREVEVHVRPVRDIDFQGFVVTGTDVTDARPRLARGVGQDQPARRPHRPADRRRDARGGRRSACPERVDAPRRPVRGAGPVRLRGVERQPRRLGRTGGDEILQAVAKQFEGLPAEVVAASRITGDSFGLLICSPSVAASLEQVVHQLHRALAGLILSNDLEVDLSFRVGYSVAPAGEPIRPPN